MHMTVLLPVARGPFAQVHQDLYVAVHVQLQRCSALQLCNSAGKGDWLFTSVFTCDIPCAMYNMYAWALLHAVQDPIEWQL